MKTNVRAKVQCGHVESLKDHEGNKIGEEIYAHAVYDSDPNSENHKWSVATPALSLNMTISNPSAFDNFRQGEDYYLDFTSV